MRILIYGLNYAPEPTGTGKYTGEMAEWLADAGHDVEVICGLPHYPGWRLEGPYADGKSRVEHHGRVRVHRASHHVPNASSLGARARIWLETSFTFSAARYWLPRLLFRRRVDVVIAVMPPMQTALWPMIYRWVRGVPWVLHVQDLQVDAALRLGLLSGRFVRFLYRVEAFLLRRAGRVSTITDAMRSRIQSKGVSPANTWLFPNWADIHTIRPLPRENAFRAELGLRPEDIAVLYSGNMGEKQGLDLILQVARACADQPRIRFFMVGDGGARSRLMRQAADMGLSNVSFLPLQPWDRVPEMLAASDIHLVVQRPEAADLVMPSKLTNILAAGRACLATAEEGTALYDVVEGHGTGMVVPPADAAAMVAAIKDLAADEGRRLAFGANARKYAEHYLDRDRVLDEFQKRLQALVMG